MSETRGMWDALTAEYMGRTGRIVPILTEDYVREFAVSQKPPVEENNWLSAALSVAGALRSDLRPGEFGRLYNLVSRGNPSLQLHPQPIEILVAIELIRPAPPTDVRKTEPPAIKPLRKRGRPKWEQEAVKQHFADAQREAEEAGDDPTRLSDVAKYFRRLNGDPDVDVRWLRTLKHRYLD